MANKKIQELAAASTPFADSDIIHGKQGTTDKKVSIEQLKGEIGSVSNFYTAGGSANIITLAVTGKTIAPSEYFEGLRLYFIVGTTNTAATTANPAGLGARSIYWNGGALTGGELIVGQLVVLTYNTITPRFDLESSFEIIDNKLTYGGASSVGTDTYAAVLPVSPITYKAGQRFQYLADVPNTGACTVNFNAIGAASIKMADGSDPFDGAIQATSVVDVEYDGTNFILLNPYFKDDYVGLTGNDLAAGEKRFSGGIGVGSASDPLILTLQVDDSGGFESNANQTIFRNNSYFSGTLKYINDGYATGVDYNNNTGDIAFRTSDTGLADAIVTGNTVVFTIKQDGSLLAGTDPVWDDSGSNGPTAVAGYTKAGSGLYLKDDITGGDITPTFNTLTAIAAPSGANGLILRVSVFLKTGGAVLKRFAGYSIYSDSGGTAPHTTGGANMLEMVSTTSGTELTSEQTEMFAPVISGSAYFKFLARDVSNNAYITYAVVGYTV